MKKNRKVKDLKKLNEVFEEENPSIVYHFASRASRFPDDNLKSRPVNLAQIEQRSLQRLY